MDKKAMYKLSYGLCVLSSREGTKDNACIVNTVIQAASEPNQVSVCVNKANFTHDQILRTGKFTVSVIDLRVDLELIRHFGFRSGKDVDKFVDFTACMRGENGIYYITEATNAYISVEVEKSLDLGSHTMYIGKVTAMEVLSHVPSATYDYYINNLKPKHEDARKNAVTKAPAELTTGKTSGQPTAEQTIWRCSVCGYEYVGEEVPKDFICPTCHHTASFFEKVE